MKNKKIILKLYQSMILKWLKKKSLKNTVENEMSIHLSIGQKAIFSIKLSV